MNKPRLHIWNNIIVTIKVLFDDCACVFKILLKYIVQ